MVNNNSALLITGANGFIGKNLSATLKAQGYTNLMLVDVDTSSADLREYVQKAAFVFHLAGVNRPQITEDFYKGNTDFTDTLISLLVEFKNTAPVLVTSSAQAGNGSDYGKSKEMAEQRIFNYASSYNIPVYVFRLPGVFGKWCRPNYNSVVATFCYNTANGLPLDIRDRSYSFPLVYVDDVVSAFHNAMLGKVDTENNFSKVTPVHTTTLGTLADTLESFHNSRTTLSVPDMNDEFVKKLYATYLSYLPENKFSYPLKMNCDERGSFTEFLRTNGQGQVSVNISKPGITKGNHWHNTKNEKFLVVKGEAIIRFRKYGDDKLIEYRVNGDSLTVVDIPTGYTHNIENIGNSDLVTLMWANEPFNKDIPDTWFEKV